MVHAETSLHLKSEMLQNLSLHLDDVEFLQNAFIVQAILGPLIRFSNRGRYEPYVAKSWSQAGNSWTFEIHEGLKCEDGEPINGESFRKSLIGSLKRFSSEDIRQMPFRYLIGVEALLAGDSSKIGIHVENEKLVLEFSQPVGKALLEYLSMSPFAFLCSSNFSQEKWKSRTSFVSSGPYRIAEFNPDQNFCKLELRKDWPLSPVGAVSVIYLSKDDLSKVQTTATVEMSYGMVKETSKRENYVLEVPRALLSVRLGIEPNHFFSKKENRKVLQAALNNVLQRTPIPFENYHRAESFFFGQMTGHEQDEVTPAKVKPPTTPLKVRAIPKGSRPEVDFYQGILFSALEMLGWQYELMDKQVINAKDFYNLSYDIAFDRSHVDSTLDPDFVRLLFKSKLGPRYQDPGKRISELVDKFDAGHMSYRDFLISFNSIISDEGAILPLFHRGFAYRFSNNVDVSTISPLMSILRYEELPLK